MGCAKTLCHAEVRKLLDYLLQGGPRQRSPRNRCRDGGMVMVMLEAGLRVGELVELRLGDLLWEDEPVGAITVRAEIAKMGVERRVPVSVSLGTEIAIMRDLLWWPVSRDLQGYCFYRRRPDVHLTTRSVEVIVRRASMAALGRPVHPHMLRHTFATNLMRVAPARVVQELLGHADLRSTQVYTHPSGEDLAAAIMAASERNKETTK